MTMSYAHSYIQCALCKRVVRKCRAYLQRCPKTYCSQACYWRAGGLFREYLEDGRFEQVLARELAQSRALHRGEVQKSLETLPSGFYRRGQRVRKGTPK